MSYLVLGNGYLGNQFADYLGGSLYTGVIKSQEDMDFIIGTRNPSVVINCIGKTGRPNIDWCESNKQETFFSNVVIPTYILNSCKTFKAEMVHIGSGCIYQGGTTEGYSETDSPNYDGSYYSWTKVVSERFLSGHDVLQLRVRMPLGNKPDPRNLITKLLGYKKVVIAANSITYIPDLLFTARRLMEQNKKGIYNVVNDGAILHSDILETYSLVSGQNLAYECVSIKELNSMTKAPRSNCVLSTKKLRAEGLAMRPARLVIKDCIKEYIKESNI